MRGACALIIDWRPPSYLYQQLLFANAKIAALEAQMKAIAMQNKTIIYMLSGLPNIKKTDEDE